MKVQRTFAFGFFVCLLALRNAFPVIRCFFPSLQDAQLLWENIQRERQRTEWRPEDEEEFEDQDGNVYRKKLYDDLIRQGIIKK